MSLIKPILLIISLFTYSLAQANVNEYLHHIKEDPKALYSFFKDMPKGGELHYHLAGGPYAETMLSLAAQGSYCLDKNTLAVSKTQDQCNGIFIKDLKNHPELYTQIIKDWSMKDFTPGKESGHDHFFKGFDKYMPIITDYKAQLIADVMTRAAVQNEQYLELMDIPDDAQSLSFGNLISSAESLENKRQILLANKDFQNNINNTVAKTDQMLKEARQYLGCDQNPDAAVCQIEVRIIYYSLREQPIDNLFSQTLTGFEATSRSKGNLVGVNLVQPEDGTISLRDYHQQMLIFNFLHKQYPQVHIALHAGELTAELVGTKDLGVHIYDALITGKAERIGHGVDILSGNKGTTTLEYMTQSKIPVEINLISNQKILNVSGSKHPLKTYLAQGVPVVFSSDDEGVLRTDLTEQYVEAVLGHGLDYPTLKQINRNTLTYAFLPGASIWADPKQGIFVNECKELNSNSCKQFIHHSQKAQLQRQLELKLIAFENKYH